MNALRLPSVVSYYPASIAYHLMHQKNKNFKVKEEKFTLEDV